MLYRQTVFSTALGIGLAAALLPPALSAESTAVAELLPENTPIALMLKTDLATWDNLTQYELFTRITEFSGQPLTPGALPFLPYGVDYLTDIDPWIGDGVAIALLPIPGAASITPQERGYLVAAVSDPTAVPDFIDTLAAVRQAEPENTSYKGIPIYHWPTEEVRFDDYDYNYDYDYDYSDDGFEVLEPSDGVELPDPILLPPALFQSLPFTPSVFSSQPEPDLDITIDPDPDFYGYTIQGLAVATFDDHLIVAFEFETVKRWIEYQLRRGPVLAESDAFLTFQAEADNKGALGLVYGNAGEIAKFTVNSPVEDLLPINIPEPTLRERAQVAALLRNVTFEALLYPQSAGLHVEARLYDGNFLLPFARGTVDRDDETILSTLPAATYLLGSGYDLANLWQDVSSALSLNELSRNLLETARTLISFTIGLDLDREILGWMDGEYTLFFFPSRSGLFNSFIPDVGVEAGVLLQTSNRSAADEALAAFDSFVGPDIAVSRQLSGTPVSSWEIDLHSTGTLQSVLSHAWVADDTLAITTGLGAMDRLVNPVAFESLTDHSTFRNATAPFPHPNYGYFYVNAAPTLAALYNLFELDPTDPFIQELKGGLGTVRSVSLTTSSTAEYLQLDALLGLAQTQ
ncbi:MAG: DUF3352 domain-containing protein [Cyanobacteria bacterium J06554_6]